MTQAGGCYAPTQRCSLPGMAAQPESEAESYAPRIIVANINRGQISANTMIGIIQSLQANVIHGLVVVESGPYLDAGRNKAVANAMQVPDWDWLLFIDSDIEFEPAHVTTLFAPTREPFYNPEECPVLGGIYANPFADDGVPGEVEGQDRVGPVVYEWVEVDNLLGEKAGIPTPTFRRLSRKALAALPGAKWWYEDDFWMDDNGDVCKVDCVGTGFLAIHRSLLTRMQATYPEPLVWFEEPVRDGVHFGEDMGFCLRLMDMGYPVLVNRACTPLHHKTMKLI